MGLVFIDGIRFISVVPSVIISWRNIDGIIDYCYPLVNKQFDPESIA